MSLLTVLDDEVEARAAAVRADRPDWPCRAGCSACCRALARPMQLTRAEWQRLDAALDAVPAPEAAALRAELHAWSPGTEAARTCPFLDPSAGRCRVYAARPIACRTYGYYVAEDGQGRWCAQIEARTDLAEVTFGHERSVEARSGDERLSWAAYRRATT